MRKFLILISIMFTILYSIILGGDTPFPSPNQIALINQFGKEFGNIANHLEFSNNSKAEYSYEIYENYFLYNDEKDYLFYKHMIPEEYLLTFLIYTKDNKDLRPLIYAMMKHETINFTSYVNTNKNSSIDKGPLMLNSANLKNNYFMRTYGPEQSEIEALGLNIENKIEKYNYYMIICINLITAHLHRYKDPNTDKTIFKALQAYNGGEVVHTKHASPRKIYLTKAYANKILNIYRETIKEYNNFINL